jgi:hypothetical protein
MNNVHSYAPLLISHPAPVRFCLYAREHKNMTAGKCHHAVTRFPAPSQSANIFQSDNF